MSHAFLKFTAIKVYTFFQKTWLYAQVW